MPRRVIGRHKAFLKAFAETASLTAAAKAAKVNRFQHYEWLKTLDGYADDFTVATRQAADLLEAEAVRRAHDGVFIPNIYKGQFVYPVKTKKVAIIDRITGLPARDPETGEKLFKEVEIVARKPLGVLKYSDGLLEFLLKGLRPERYRTTTELTGTVKQVHRFEGPMEELLATYRRLAAEEHERS